MKTSVKAQFVGFVSHVDHEAQKVTLGDVQVTLNPWPHSINTGDVIETLAHFHNNTWTSSEVSHLSNPFSQNSSAPISQEQPPRVAATPPARTEAPKVAESTPNAVAKESQSHLSVVPTESQRTSRAGRFGGATQNRPPSTTAPQPLRPAFQANSNSSATSGSVMDDQIPF